MVSKEFQGRVVAVHGHRNFVEDPHGNLLEAIRKGRKGDVVVGDQVICHRTADASQCSIEKVLPRKSLLFRSDQFRTKPMAANIDQTAVVFASRPVFNKHFIWRAILACDAANIPLIAIRNKTDFVEDNASIRPFVEQLESLGVHTVEISVKTQPVEAKLILIPIFEHKITLLIGQSGMGKSSILNLLIENAQQKTQEYSTALNLGKQTTTSVRLFQFGKDGAIVESPGFQEFGLAHLTVEDLINGMPEIKALKGHCRFANCRHLEEPDCAVKKAVADGTIDSSRYDFYKDLRLQLGK
ncbi:MAG: ribosome small subunit-dependent GTPase A [Burkholderiales bacterium]|nr:ribosome small subunit-dependent GTPase A [Burkholderiales bacterium]